MQAQTEAPLSQLAPHHGSPISLPPRVLPSWINSKEGCGSCNLLTPWFSILWLLFLLSLFYLCPYCHRLGGEGFFGGVGSRWVCPARVGNGLPWAATRWIEEGVIWYGGCGMKDEKNLVARTSGTSRTTI